jgi:hypothetical protein
VEAYQANDFTAASDKLEKAYALLPVPSLGLWSGRALVKVGKWVEATDRFLEATSLQVPSGEYAVQKQAQADAALELKELRPKVPVVTVQVEGAAVADCTLSVDGQTVSSSLLTSGRLMNPGKHVIEGRRGSDQARVELTVSEGQRPTVVLKFEAPIAPAAAVVVAPPPAPPPPRPTNESSGSVQRTAGWVTLAAGGVGLVIGGITGGIALGKKNELEDNPNCSGDRCAPSEKGKVDSYNGMTTVSSVGFIAGGVLSGLGIVLLVTAPSSASAQAFVGPQSVGVRGRF